MKYRIVALVTFEIETSAASDDDFDELEEKKLAVEQQLAAFGISLGSIESEEPIG